MRGPIPRALLVAAVSGLVGLAACADRDGPAPTPGGSTYGPGSPASAGGGSPSEESDAGDGGADGGADGGCLERDDYDFEFFTDVGGEMALAGVITTPAPIEQNRAVVLEIMESTSAQVRRAQFTAPPPRDQFRYRVAGLTPGNWLVRALVDQSGSPQVGEPGDLEGFYAGTEAAPIRDRAVADIVEIQDTCPEDIDFGIGVRF